MSDCVLKTLACRGLRVGPSKPKRFPEALFPDLWRSCVQMIADDVAAALGIRTNKNQIPIGFLQNSRH